MKRSQHAEKLKSREDVRRDEERGNGQGQSGADRAVEVGAGALDGQAAEVVSSSAREAAAKYPYLTLTEAGIKDALIEARGDIFVASQMLGITALRLDRAIRVSAELQNVFLAVKEERGNVEFDKLSAESLNQAVEKRLALYRVAGLDSLYELATMPIDDNSAQNQVRLAAAARLAGSPEAGGAGGDVAEALRALNQAYHEQAPRLRVVRERLTVEVAPGEKDVTPQ